LDGNRPRTHPSARSRRKAPRKSLKAKAGALDRSLQDSLTDIARHLEIIGAVAVTAEVALRAQNCEQDADIALCMRYGLVDALTTQIERMRRLSASTPGHVPGKHAAARVAATGTELRR
jgi:hypothetical protein